MLGRDQEPVSQRDLIHRAIILKRRRARRVFSRNAAADLADRRAERRARRGRRADQHVGRAQLATGLSGSARRRTEPVRIRAHDRHEPRMLRRDRGRRRDRLKVPSEPHDRGAQQPDRVRQPSRRARRPRDLSLGRGKLGLLAAERREVRRRRPGWARCVVVVAGAGAVAVAVVVPWCDVAVACEPRRG